MLTAFCILIIITTSLRLGADIANPDSSISRVFVDLFVLACAVATLAVGSI